MALDSANQFAYEADFGTTPGMYGYKINGITGALTTMVGSPFLASTSPYAATIDSSNKFMYVVDRGAIPGLYAYAINSTIGSLTRMPNSPYLMSSAPNDVRLISILQPRYP